MTDPAPAPKYELVLDRLLDAPREKLYRCWTEAELMKPWFCPQPWSVSHVEVDMRPGGSSLIVMNGPNGEVMPNRGVYLEVVPNEKLVFTDAFTSAWVPSEKAFMVVELTFADEGRKTRYRAVARHWSEEDMKMHQQMGFEEGWGIVATQLEAYAKTI